MGVTLSVDYDFFVWSGINARLQARSPDGGEPVEVSGRSMFDWGHSESIAAGDAEWLWLNRWLGMAAFGLDPEQTAAIRPEDGCVRVRDFVEELDRRYDLNAAALWIADSHAYGYTTMQNAANDCGSPIEHLISFDAHHDLGYNREGVGKQRELHLVSCESWLYHALRLGHVERATIVYPAWRGLTEWRGVRSSSWLRRMHGRIDAITWSDWLARTAAAKREEVEVVFGCRSSTWVPPWTDTGFAELIERLSTWTRSPQCWDCLAGGFAQRVGDQNACTPRQWDRGKAEAALAAWESDGLLGNVGT